MEDNGLEQDSGSGCSESDLGKSAIRFGTDSGTVQGETGTLPPDLAVVVNVWPALSEIARKEILQVIRLELSAKAVD